MTNELTNILSACRTICEHPYDNEVILDTTYNGHHIRKYERSLAAVVIDGGIVNMGAINERYPDGSVAFQVGQVSMTGLQFIRYKLTGLLPMMVTCPECGTRFSIFPDDVTLDYGYRTWCNECDHDFEVDIPDTWAAFIWEQDTCTVDYTADILAQYERKVYTCEDDKKYLAVDQATGEEYFLYAHSPEHASQRFYHEAGLVRFDLFECGAVDMFLGENDYSDELAAALPEPGNDTGAMVEYTDGSEAWEDVHYTVSYEGKVFPADQGTVNYQHYNSWEKAIAMYDYCEDHELDPYLHDNHYGVCLHCDEWN